MGSQIGSSNYDVFINFRGPDTRNTFVGHLHKALRDRGIRAFIDSEDLWKGEDIGSTLLEAIKGSKISIVVLSKRYAESRWCLKELNQILECHRTDGQIIFPIFFHVDTSNVKNQTESFEISPDRHGKEASETLNKWKDTLREVGDISGWVVNNGDDESELVAKVTQKTWIRLNIVHLIDVKHPVGLESRVTSVLSLLSNTSTTNSKDTQFIGICGQGGIGKTTIATAVYNYISKDFSKSCFIGDVRAKASQPNGIVCLQQDLVRAMFHEEEKFCSSQEGSRLIKDRLQNTKTLLVLDDVGNPTELEALAGDQSWFGSESRIIVTARDQSVLSRVPKNIRSICEPDELNPEESLQLFSLHAFSADKPLEEYKHLSIDIANTAAGLPLALVVLGCDLTVTEDKEVWESKKVWESRLRMLQQLPDDSVYEKLKTTFDDLPPIEQSMFLDAACFFIGWEEETIISIWEACDFKPEYRVEVLKRKFLLKFKGDNSYWGGGGRKVLQMHDQLRDMGRRIVYNQRPDNPNYHTRLWSLENFMKGHEGNKVVEGIMIEGFNETCIPTKYFKKMHKLRLLQVDRAVLEGSFDYLPSQLRWLTWLHCPLKELDSDFCHEELVVLDLTLGNLTQAFNKWPKKRQFQHLKVLRLNYNIGLSESPDFSGFPLLEELHLGYCSELVEVHESIGELQKLVYLNLCWCDNLRMLPDNICRLRSLKKFILNDCRSLEELPNSICRLSSLQELDLSDCNSLKQLPSSVGDLKESLTKLSLGGQDMKIDAFPDGVELLNKLEALHLYFNHELIHLPRSMVNMTSLRSLTLTGFGKLLQIPKLPPSLECFSVHNYWVKVEKFRGNGKTNRIDGEHKYNELMRKLSRSCCVVTVTDQSRLTEPILTDNINSCSREIWIPVQQKRDEKNGFPCFSIPDDAAGEVGSNGSLVMHLSMRVENPKSFVFVESCIDRKSVKTRCDVLLEIEGAIESNPPGGHIEFIHEFQGFDWFGVQLKGGEAIQVRYLQLYHNLREMNLFLIKERQSMLGDQFQYHGDDEFLEIVRYPRTTEDEHISETTTSLEGKKRRRGEDDEDEPRLKSTLKEEEGMTHETGQH